jgi:2-polyprenyl-3-methyl-5-hydroxy-6-metoxy-1,4-benzoquinol methylase
LLEGNPFDFSIDFCYDRRVIHEDKAIRLGHPSYVWRFGQDRRLDLIRNAVPLEGASILDVGCGVGAYVTRLRALTAVAFGVDVDYDKLLRARTEKGLEALALGVSEALPFPDGAFDAVLLHEVIEHVADDAQTVHEAHRVVKSGGAVIVFAPNRLFPFETHGAYIGSRYVFGNIPLLGYLPDILRRRLAPHVRAYRTDDLARLFAGLNGEIEHHTQIYPGYDKIARRVPPLARLFRKTTYWLESTPLRAFGLSHFLVWRKS